MKALFAALLVAASAHADGGPDESADAGAPVTLSAVTVNAGTLNVGTLNVADAGTVARTAAVFGCDPPAEQDPGDVEFLPHFLETRDKPEPGSSYRTAKDKGEVEAKGKDQGPPPELAYLNGIGSPGRCWEFTSDTAFGNRRIFTQRLEIARAFKVTNRSLAGVLRIGLGADAQLSTGLSAIQGIAVSVGLRHFPVGGFSVEYGLRVIPGWKGPQDKDPQTQALALGATLTSGIGNDAAWLPFSNGGVQLYVDFQTRTGRWFLTPGWTLLAGARYGLATSLGTLQVHTWLGPQSAFIGNLHGELYLGMPTLRGVATALQVGGHVDVSLSSIWPGDQAFPIVGNFFIGWSPATWLSFRGFVGHGVSLAAINKVPGALLYGVRLQFYVP